MMKTMKGFVFTLDSIFALVVAIVAVSILLYFVYVPQEPRLLKYSESQALLNDMLSTNVSAIVLNNSFARLISYQDTGLNQTSPEQFKNVSDSSSNPTGPLEPFISYTYILPPPFTGFTVNPVGMAAGFGNVYVTYNGVASGVCPLFCYYYGIAAINARNGATAWSTQIRIANTPAVSPPVLYDNLLLFANGTYLIALNPQTGASVWTTNLIAAGANTLDSPLIAYDGQIMFGANTPSSDSIFAFYAANGTFAWSSSAPFVVNSISIAYGTPVVSSTTTSISNPVAAGNVMLLVQENNQLAQYWQRSYSSSTTYASTYQNIIAFGSGSQENGLYTDGSLAFTQTALSNVQGVSNLNGNFIFQSNNAVTSINANGVVLWNVPIGSQYGKAVTNATPATSSAYVYTIWGNNYILALNTTTGSIAWSTQVPNQISAGMQLNPYPMLAYGKLFVLVNNTLIAYGSCNAYSHDSLLKSVGSMYLYGNGGCADSLMSSSFPNANYSIFINGSYAPGLHIATFNSLLNASVGLGGGTTLTNQYTWSFWFDPTIWNVNTIILGQNDLSLGSPAMIETSNSANPYVIEFTIDNGLSSYTVNAPIVLNKWQQVVGTYKLSNSNGILTIYINGVKVAQTTGPFTSRNFGNLTLGTGPQLQQRKEYISGQVADLQTYSSVIPYQQILQLYASGIQAAPVNGSISGWYPLDGDANDYSGHFNTGYPWMVSYTNANLIPVTLQNAYQINKAQVVLPLSSANRTALYIVGVYNWK